MVLLPGVPAVDPAWLPDCHALGEAPEGYSAKQSGVCANCRDKFSCLPASIDKGIGPPAGLEADQEVLALSRGLIDYSAGIKRMLQRHALGAAPIPFALRHTTPIAPKVKPAVKREWKARAGTISPERMQAHLQGPHTYKDRGVRIGQTITLCVGMRLVRRKSDGTECVVVLRVDGYEARGICYPSLSTAAIALVGRSVSGNDFFHLCHKKAEVRNEHDEVILRGGNEATDC